MTKPLKVLHILFELRSSGAEVMIKEATPFWKQNGIDIHVLSTAQVIGDFSESLLNEGIVIHHIPFENSFLFFQKIVNLLRFHQFDIVQIHVEHTFLSFPILARIARIPTIIRVIHTTFLYKGKVRFNRAVRRWIVRLLGIIQVSVSDSVRKNEIERFNNPTLLINNWYDDTYFFPPSIQEREDARNLFGLSGNDNVIVSVGNCSPAKNHKSIIKALLLIKEAGIDLKYWHIGEEDLEENDKKLVNNLKLEANIQFWGRQEDVRRFLWAADVFVMPSFYEGFGIAALEAYACGLKVIMANTPGLDFWGSYFPDIVFTEPNPQNLAHWIMESFTGQVVNIDHDQEILSTHFGVLCGAKKYLALYKGHDAV